MPDLEDIRLQLVVLMRKKPVFLWPLRITNEQKTHHAIRDTNDGAGQIRIVQTGGPDGVGREKRKHYPVDYNGIARVNAMPGDRACARRLQRGIIGL